MKWIRDGSVILTVFTAFLFLLGREYLNSYHGWFGVDVNSLDLPAYSSILASLNTLLGFDLNTALSMLGIILPILLLALIPAGLESFWVRAFLGRGRHKITSLWYRTLKRSSSESIHERVTSEPHDRPFKAPLLPNQTDNPTTKPVGPSLSFVITLVLLIEITLLRTAWVAQDRGKEDAERDYLRPRVKAVLTIKKDEIQMLSKDFQNINSGGGLRLLAQTPFLVVVFVKPDWSVGYKAASIHPLTFTIPTSSLDAVETQSLEAR
jgi:hypothetical protein